MQIIFESWSFKTPGNSLRMIHIFFNCVDLVLNENAISIKIKKIKWNEYIRTNNLTPV